MTNDKLTFIDVRELLRSNQIENQMDEILQVTGTGQTVVINFLKLKSAAPAKFREILFSWVNSKYSNRPMIYINIKEDFRVNLLEEEAAKILRPGFRVIPAFDQYFELMGWVGLTEKEDPIGKLLNKIFLVGIMPEHSISDHPRLYDILRKNTGLFKADRKSWSGALSPEDVFEAEIKQEISKRGAHIKGDHIELSPTMHSEEYIEGIRFIEDQDLIERISRQLYTKIISSIDTLECIVTFGHPGAILAMAFSNLLKSHGKQLPYIVFKDEDSPFAINPEPLKGKMVLLLLDVICTGRLANKICRQIEAEGGIIGEIATVVKVNVPKEDGVMDKIHRLCQYQFKIWPPEKCELCKNDFISKRPEPYYKTIRSIPRQQISYFRDLFGEYRKDLFPFWAMVDKAGALREHVRITDKDRHFFYYIDAYSIFKTKEHIALILENIHRKLSTYIHPLPEKITLLHPPNLSSLLLADELRHFWVDQKSPDGVLHPQDIYIVGSFREEGRLKVEEKDNAFIKGSVLILDDGANTGETLRSLMSICSGDTVERVDACIFMDRLPAEERFSIKRLLAGKNGKLISLYEVPIATYIQNPIDCPYCRELKTLEQLKESLTTPEAIKYCMQRIEKLKPLEKEEKSLAIEYSKKQRGSKIELGNIKVSEAIFKAIVLHLKWKLRREDRASIPLLDVLDETLDPLVKIALMETLDEKEIQNPRVFEIMINVFAGTRDVRLFETIIRALVNVQDMRCLYKLKDTTIEKIPKEEIPFFAFLNEICQLRNGRDFDSWWPNFRRRIEGGKEEIEKIEIISRVGGGLIGKSAAIKGILESIKEIAGRNSDVLITGESGTGKQLVAEAIYKNSGRASKIFVTIDCAGLAESIIDSELFGHVRGAFTGAMARKVGLFEQANGGTVFLDEVGNIPFSTQAKLLRVLQERVIKRVGDTGDIKIDVRIIAATNKDLKQLVREGKFREDLFYRLNVVPIQIPPLRERSEDIPVLSNHFLGIYAAKNNKTLDKISSEALALLTRHDWPGNVRELQNCIDSAVAFAKGNTLELKNLPASMIPETQKTGRKDQETLKEMEKRAIVEALKQFEGNQSRAGELLGLTEKALRSKMKKHGISNPYPTKPGRPKKNRPI